MGNTGGGGGGRTAAGVDFELPVDVAFIHQGVEDVEDAVHVPDLRVAPQELDLLVGLLGRLTAVLTEGLELDGTGSNKCSVVVPFILFSLV